MPTQDLSIDVETYSPVDLPKCGAWKYARHPEAKILIIAWSLDGGEVQRWKEGDPLSELEDLRLTMLSPGVRIWAYNANFERAMLSGPAGRKLKLPNPPAEKFYCTQALGLMCGYPGSLFRLNEALGMRLNKDKLGPSLMKKFSIPDENGEVKNPADFPEEFMAYANYCVQDVIVEQQARQALPLQEFPAHVHDAWVADTIMNERGILLDRQFIEGAISISAQAKARAEPLLKQLTGGAVETIGQIKACREYLNSIGCDIPDLKAETVEKYLDTMPLSEKARQILQLRQDNGKSSTAKYAAALEAMCDDDRVRGVAQFHGAHTGRWAGRIIQFQNLPRPETKNGEAKRKKADFEIYRPVIKDASWETLFVLDGAPMGVLRDVCRHMVIAPPGKKLIVCDWNAIEARILGWMANDAFYLKCFKEKLDPYKATAARVYGKSIDAITKLEREFGKTAFLGLGYAMWWETFKEACFKKKLIVSESLLRRAVDEYRKLCVGVVKWWADCEAAMVRAIETQEEVVLRNVVFGHDGRHAWIRLPSGRYLWYPEARIEMRPMGRSGKLKKAIAYMHETDKGGPASNWWVKTWTYGGKLVENIVQAIGADLVMEWTIRMREEPDMQAVFHVHDEGIAEAALHVTPQALEHAMCVLPSWAEGLPIKAEAFETTYYRK